MEEFKKALIITYYWPPSGGSGVQRWLKFSKYLRNFNWEPVIYTPENPEIPVEDSSLLKDIPEGITVLKKKIWEPYSFYKRFLGQKGENRIQTGFLTEKRKPKQKEKISVWIRGNLFIPDARKFWIRPSVKYLTTYLKSNPVDIIISTGPPHSMHLIARKLKKKLNIPWLADFRDPWTNIDFYKDLKLTCWADKKHKKQEQLIIKEADSLIVVGNTLKKEYQNMGANNVSVITNGYDQDDYIDDDICLDKKFSIMHAGTITFSRNPTEFWPVLFELVNEHPDFAEDLEIKLIGKIDLSVNENITRLGLEKFVVKTNYLSHKEVIREQKKSHVLFLPINNTFNAKGIITGKLFEYLAAGRPILGIGPADGDAAEIINDTKAGLISGFGDNNKLKNNILALYQNYKKGKLQIRSGDFSKYSRKNLTENLVELLNASVK